MALSAMAVPFGASGMTLRFRPTGPNTVSKSMESACLLVDSTSQGQVTHTL